MDVEDAHANTTNPISVRVTDNGNPPLSDAKTFTVTVVPRPTLTALGSSGSDLILNWDALLGATYRVEYKTASPILRGNNWGRTSARPILCCRSTTLVSARTRSDSTGCWWFGNILPHAGLRR